MDMSRISKKPIPVILFTGIISLAIGVASPAILGVVKQNLSTLDRGWFARSEASSSLWQQTGARDQSESRLSLYRIPDSLDFCGERVPLEIPDVRERMEQTLHDMNMLADLEYLPVAESALRDLVSSKDAAGIWQFTDDTAKRYGLIVNEHVDERYNFRKATEAALRFLNDLHTKFGTWSLAAAAYNMGSSGLKASLDYQMVSDYYSLYLNDETYRFVFRVVALKEIISHYKEYGFALTAADFYQPAETRLVVAARIPDIAAWAREQGASYKEIKDLNPWILNHSLTTGTWAIELPMYAERVVFTSPAPVIDTFADSNAEVLPDRDELIYVVKPGDNLEKIAAIYRVSVKDIVAWNNLQNEGLLWVGKRLKILTGGNPEPLK